MAQVNNITQSIPQAETQKTGLEPKENAQTQNTTAPAEAQVPKRAGPLVFEQIQATKAQLHRLSDTAVKFHNKSLDAKTLDDIVPTKGKLSGTAQAALALVKAKFIEVNITMSELDASKLQDIVHAETIDPVVENSIQAQHKLRAALVLYSEETGIDVTEHVRMCDNRAAEILNFMGEIMRQRLPTGLPEHLHDKNITDALNVSSIDMHGNEQLMLHLSKDINDIYAKLESIENNATMMEPAEFNETMQNLTQNIQSSITKLHNTQKGMAVAGHDANLTVHFDQKAIKAMEVSLDAAQKRLDLLKNSSVHQNIRDMLTNIGTTYAGPSKQLAKVLNKVNKDMKNVLLTHYKNLDNVFNILKKQPLDVRKLQEALQKVEDYCNDNVLTSVTFAVDLMLAQEKDVAVYDAKIAEMQARNDKQVNDRINNIIRPLRELELQTPGVTDSLQLSWYPSLKKECQRVLDFMRSNPQDTHKSGAYINMAFSGAVNIATLAELKLRNLPLRNVALDAIDAHLKEPPTTLGKGAANEVFLCKYTSPDTGQEVKYVFKAELGAKKGLDGLAVSKLGYADSVYFNNINVATTEVAERIACGSAVAKSSLGMHKGQFGLFMEFAQGKTVGAYAENADLPVYKALNRNISLQQLKGALSLEEQAVFIASLAKELTKLEWADALTGQVDRHRENYLFAMDPTTFQAKITGIDNDASFSKGIVGPAKLQAAPGTTIIDLSALEGRDCGLYAGPKGINQMFKPMFITRETYDALANLSIEEYRELLQDRIPEENMPAAIMRLNEAKAYALELEREGKCLSDAEWMSKKFYTTLNDTVVDQVKTRPIYQQNFIARDFCDVMPMVLDLKYFTNE